jgi:hypothetical protein
MDEGWTRWIFDQNGIPYARLVDDDIRKGGLASKFDVIIVPDNSASAITKGIAGRGGEGDESGPPVPPEFKGGLGEKGTAALHEFVETGGTIVTLNRASTVYATKDSTQVKNVLEGVTNRDFYIPGSILDVKVDTSHPIGFGAPATIPIFFEQSPAFDVRGDARSIANYASDNPLRSGWILGGKYLAGNSALAEEPIGKGRVILFGFRPQYRAQSEVTYKLFFNSLFYATTSRPAGSGKGDN